MKTKTRFKVIALQAGSAEEFNERIAEALENATAPKITYMQGVPFAAYVEYKEVVEIPETIAERYELEGKTGHCGECPFMVRTADKRCKWHYCAQKGQKTKETCPACDIFYELKEATSWED